VAREWEEGIVSGKARRLEPCGAPAHLSFGAGKSTWAALVFWMGIFLPRNFCPKCRKFLCACLVSASIAASIAGYMTVGVQGDLPSAHFMGALASGTTGTVSQNTDVYNTITDEEYVGFWPDQRRVAVVGPTGQTGGRPRVAARLTGPTGPARSVSGSELPKGPTGTAR